MLNDGYVEDIVEAKIPKGTWIGTALGIFIIIAAIMSLVISGWGITFIVVGVVVIIIAMSFKDVEYEYLFLNDSVDIAKISRKSKRKDVYHFEKGEVTVIAATDSIYIDNIHQKDGYVKVLDYSGTAGKKEPELVYAFMINKGNSYEEVHLRVSEKVMKHLQQFFKDKIK